MMSLVYMMSTLRVDYINTHSTKMERKSGSLMLSIRVSDHLRSYLHQQRNNLMRRKDVN